MRKLKRAVIKEELVAITGNWKLSLVLNQLLYWTERIGSERYKKWLEEESNRQLGNTDDLKGGWIYKKSEDLKEELMLDVDETTIRRWLKKLNEKNLILERNNPNNKWDNTKQYRINAIQLVKILHKKGYKLEGYRYDELLTKLSKSPKTPKRDNTGSNMNNTDSKRDNAGSKQDNTGTIPEITTENTLETITNLNNKIEEEERTREKNIPVDIRVKYEEIFSRTLSTQIYNKILKFYSDPKIIMKALLIAEEKGDKPSYLLKLLSDWQNNGLTSISNINTYLANRQAQNGNKREYKRYIKDKSLEEMKKDGWR